MKKSGSKKALYVTLLILIVTILFTVSYAAFSDDLTITNTVAKIRVDKVIRINGVTTQSGAVSNLDYSSASLLNTVYIPAGGTVTYEVVVTNLGNVPMAVSGVSFSSKTGNTNNLSSNISPSNYVKICDNNVCTGGVSKTVSVTITNNGSETISTDLDVNLAFSEVYKIEYDGMTLGETVAGENFSYTFTSNAPPRLAKESGTCDSFSYANGVLTVTNVGSDLSFINAYIINYNGESIGYATPGSNFTYTFDSKWPASITADSGTYTGLTYQNKVLTITNVGSDISLTGTIGTVAITRIQYISSKNVTSQTTPTFNGMNAEFNVTFHKDEDSTEDEFEIIYEVDLSNTHYNDYIFRGIDFHPSIVSAADSDTATLTLTPVGVTNGEIIASGSVKTFRIVLTLETNNPNGSYETGSSTNLDTTPDTEEETGDITATITPDTGDLRAPNTRVPFTVSVTNTYKTDREFRLVSSNSNIELVDANGNALNNLTVHAESTEQYTVYARVAQGATFINGTTSMSVYLGTEGSPNITVGTSLFNVDVYDVPDTTKVTVGNLQFQYYYDTTNKSPKVRATWDRIDMGGSSVTNYVVRAYQTNGTLASTCQTNSSTRVCDFTNLTSGTTYYGIVYGIDEAGNSGESNVNGATSANGYATRSSNFSFTWRFTVSVTATDLAVSGDGNTAILGASHTIILTASGSSYGTPYTAPENPTVTMANSSGNFYTYARSGTNNTVGTITISNVTGNITVNTSREGGCLVEGTKILLANGKYKNIENIGYDDLIMVYSYETGELTPEYPIWIENPTVSKRYQQTTFSDGTILKTVSYHGVYETELNRFVSVDNREEFHVGSKIAKITKDGIKEVTVTKIEEKEEIVRYYLIASTRYFNVIANDILTTDGNLYLSNLYGFNKDITWPENNHEESLKDVYKYEEVSDILPHHLFMGMRAGEGKYLTRFGIDYNTYREFLKLITIKDDRFRLPINNFGKNMWMVTTSEDNVNEINKDKYLRFENSTYVLPNGKNSNLVGWLNTADNKIYYPGDKVIVYYGMYFKAIYK